MWRYLLLLAILATPIICRADSIQFPVPPSDTGPVYSDGNFVQLFSSALDGTVLDGQSLSLSLILGGGDLARFHDGGDISIEFLTNAPFDFVEFLGPSTTGYLLGPSGNEIGTPMVLGRAGANNGGLITGLDLPPSGTIDISGIDLNLMFPDTGYTITGIDFLLGTSDATGASFQLGTANQLPEPPTSELILAGLLILPLLPKSLRRSLARPTSRA